MIYREPPPRLFYCSAGCSPAWRTSYDEPCGHADEREVHFGLKRSALGEEPFRYCVYCDADCESPEPPHADDCHT